MKRLVVIVATAFFALLGMSLPANAKVDDNPNARETVGVVCDDGTIFESLWGPSFGKSVSGLDLDGKRVIVATSTYATIDGDPVGVLFDRPGRGLDDLTVWCVWNEPFSPTGQAGAHLLIAGRP